MRNPSKLGTVVNGQSVTFERRRYGTQFYCWANVLNGSEVLSCGDPWPAANWPKQALAQAVNFAMAGKVQADPAICSNCGQFNFHSEICSQYQAQAA